jgi:hypothetical protein
MTSLARAFRVALSDRGGLWAPIKILVLPGKSSAGVRTRAFRRRAIKALFHRREKS